MTSCIIQRSHCCATHTINGTAPAALRGLVGHLEVDQVIQCNQKKLLLGEQLTLTAVLQQ